MVDQRNYPGRFKTVGSAGLLAGALLNVKLMAGERPWFMSVIGDALGGANGTITFEQATWTIIPGATLTISGDSWPVYCENWKIERMITFNGVLRSVIFNWGPLCMST